MGIRWRSFIPRFLQRKSSSVNRLIAAWFLGEPVWTPTDFGNLAREGFEKNVWVYRCVMSIAQAGSSVPWILYRKDRTGTLKELYHHPFLDLWNRPNPMMSKQQFLENVIAFQLLAGNAYIQEAGPKNGPPMELWVLRPDRVRIIAGRDGIAGYEYKIDEQLKQKFPPDIITHFKLFSALDDWYGLSPIQVAARGIDADNFANAWNASLFQNGARPSGAMITEGTLSEEQYKRLKQEIREQYSGMKNSGRPMLLEGGLDWKEMSLSPKDMDFIESKKLSRLEICAAFGVPPELLGDHEHATYSNYQEARKAFYQDTVIPILVRIRDKINSHILPKFGDNLYLDIDRDEIDALQEDRDRVWDRAIRAVQYGILEVNEAREAMGYEAIDGGNVRYVPASVLPEGEDAPDWDDLLGGGSSSSDPDDDGGGSSSSDPDDDKSLELKGLNLQTPIQKKQYWRAFDRRRIGYYGAVGKQIKKRFEQEMKGVLKAFDEGGPDEVDIYLNDNAIEWSKTLTAVYMTVMKAFGDSVYQYLMSKNGSVSLEKKEFDVFNEAVQRFISETVANKVVNINDNTKKLIKNIVHAGFEEQLTVPEIRDKIEKLYLEQIIPNRSMVIARTEVISASNAGSHYAAKQTGLELEKEWVATADDRTRDTHEEVNGQRVPIDEPFKVGVSELMFPGDPNGEPEEVIQCRCTEVYHTVKS